MNKKLIHQTTSSSASGGDGFALRRPDCPRSGRSARRNSNSRFLVADTAALPPRIISDEVERLLGKLAFGPQASLSNDSCRKWISELRGMLEGKGRAIEELPTYSLEDLAKRCDRAESSTCVAKFVQMLTELYFFAKINAYDYIFSSFIVLTDLPCLRSINNERVLQNDTRRPNVSKWVQLVQSRTDIPRRKLEVWVQAGTRWAILAHSGEFPLMCEFCKAELVLEDPYTC